MTIPGTSSVSLRALDSLPDEDMEFRKSLPISYSDVHPTNKSNRVFSQSDHANFAQNKAAAAAFALFSDAIKKGKTG